MRALEVDGERAEAAVRGEAEGGARVEYLTSGLGDKFIVRKVESQADTPCKKGQSMVLHRDKQ